VQSAWFTALRGLLSWFFTWTLPSWCARAPGGEGSGSERSGSSLLNWSRSGGSGSATEGGKGKGHQAGCRTTMLGSRTTGRPGRSPHGRGWMRPSPPHGHLQGLCPTAAVSLAPMAVGWRAMGGRRGVRLQGCTEGRSEGNQPVWSQSGCSWDKHLGGKSIMWRESCRVAAWE